jgi:hypothetical protein
MVECMVKDLGIPGGRSGVLISKAGPGEKWGCQPINCRVSPIKGEGPH